MVEYYDVINVLLGYGYFKRFRNSFFVCLYYNNKPTETNINFKIMCTMSPLIHQIQYNTPIHQKFLILYKNGGIMKSFTNGYNGYNSFRNEVRKPY